jgi:hypothetical protein
VNADSINIFIDLVQAQFPSTSKNLNFAFQQIYQNNLPPPIRQHFTNVYLFCLHKDPLNKSKLRPLGIPTAIRRLIASHVAHTFRKKFARHMLPFNYAIGTPNGTNLIINTMQLQVEKNTYPSPNRLDASQPVQQFSSTSQIISTASPMKPSSMSLLNYSQKCSHSPHSSTNMPELSTTSGLMAHGALYSWKRASARAVHSFPFLHPLSSPTSSNHLTLNYVKEPQLGSSTATLAMMVLEALHISLDT